MAANGAQPTRHAKPPPTGPTPPAPAAAPPAPPNNAHAHAHSSSNARQPNGAVNGTHAHTQKAKKKAADPPPVDPSQMYETLKNRIAALEEEEVHEEEEERRFGEWPYAMRPRRSSRLWAVFGWGGSGTDVVFECAF